MRLLDQPSCCPVKAQPVFDRCGLLTRQGCGVRLGGAGDAMPRSGTERGPEVIRNGYAAGRAWNLEALCGFRDCR